MSTFRLYFRALFGTFFLKVFLEWDCNGEKDPCAVLRCNNDRLFPEKYAVKDHISNTKLKKAIIFTSKHGTGIFFPIKILF